MTNLTKTKKLAKLDNVQCQQCKNVDKNRFQLIQFGKKSITPVWPISLNLAEKSFDLEYPIWLLCCDCGRVSVYADGIPCSELVLKNG